MLARSSTRLWVHPLLIATLLCAVFVSTLATPVMGMSQTEGEIVLGPRGDAGQTGVMPGTGPVSQPAILWEAPSDDGVIMGMAIHDNLLYFATKDPGLVRAVDRASGAVSWTADLGVESTVFGPEVAGDLVVVGVWASEGNAIVALDGATGAERWRVATGNLPTAPTYVDGTVYVPAEGGLESDSSLYALDAATGNQRWVFATPEAKDLGERVAVADGVVVASAWSLDDNGVGVYAIDTASGQPIWTFSEVDELITEPIVRDGVVLVTDLPRTWALDLRTGGTLWEHSGVDTGGGVAFGNGVAYFGYGDQVQAVSARDGSPLWSASVTGIAGAPVIAGGIVYTAVWRRADDRDNHWLHAFDAATGAEVWSLELEHEVDGNQPLAHDGVLYVDTDNAVVAFGSGQAQGQPGSAPTTAPAAQADPGTYTSAEFGHTVQWGPPWELIEPQSSASPGQDFVTLQNGDTSLGVRATSEVTSAVELIQFYVSNIQTSQADAQVFEMVEDPDLSRATARFTVNGTPMVEYIEVRPLPGGTGLFLTILYGPADRFAQDYLSMQQVVSVDQQPPFRNAPAAEALAG